MLRDPQHSVPQLLSLPDQIHSEVVADDPEDPDNLSPKHAKRSLHHVVRGMSLIDLQPSILEAIASLDGAVVTDLDARLLTFGAILRIAPETLELGRAVQGAGPSPRSPPRCTGRSSRSARTAISPCSSRDGGSGICRRSWV